MAKITIEYPGSMNTWDIFHIYLKQFFQWLEAKGETGGWEPLDTYRWAFSSGVELTMQVGSTPDLRTWILSFGSGAEVLEPLALRREVQDEHRDALRRYQSATQ